MFGNDSYDPTPPFARAETGPLVRQDWTLVHGKLAMHPIAIVPKFPDEAYVTHDLAFSDPRVDRLGDRARSAVPGIFRDGDEHGCRDA